MTVAEVLIHVPFIWFGLIVTALHLLRISRYESCSVIEIERDVALQTNRETQVSAGRKVDSAAARGSGSVDCSVDGRRVDTLPIACGAKIFHVIKVCEVDYWAQQ